MMGRQRPNYKSLWADKDQFITHDGQSKTSLYLMMGRQRPNYKS